MSIYTDLVTSEVGERDALDPTVAAPLTNVAEYGFEGRFEDWLRTRATSSTPRPQTRSDPGTR